MIEIFYSSKNKNLAMTDEEKRHFREQQMTGKIRGLVQRCLDGFLPIDRFRAKMSAIQGKDKDMADRLLRKEVFNGFEPGKGNEIAMVILNEILGVDTELISERSKAFSDQIEVERSIRVKRLMAGFEKRSISGSAVIPNPDADSDWKIFVVEKLGSFREKLMAESG